MAEARTAGALREALATFRLMGPEQRAAAVGALLLVASTFGPFSAVEAAEILLAVAVLALLRARANGKRFHLPFGDGTVIAAAGIWAGVLIVVRLFDRPLGQNLLALACAAILLLAGARERATRPADDLPAERPDGRADSARPSPRPARQAGRGAPHDATEPLEPPEFEPYEPKAGEQLRLPRGQPPDA